MAEYLNTVDANRNTEPIPESTCQVGIPLRCRGIAIEDTEICIFGPPIEVFHPADYNTMPKPWESPVWIDMKYGINGLYNIRSGHWILPANILEIDAKGTTITIDDPSTVVGDNFVVRYYAKVNRFGGRDHTLQHGQGVWPYYFDIPVKVFNDAVPTMMGAKATRITDQYNWIWHVDAYHDATSHTGGGWQNVLDTDDAGVEKCTDAAFPLIVTRIRVLINVDELDDTQDKLDIPDDIRFRITADGKDLLAGYSLDDSVSYWASFGRLDSNHDDYDAERSPGSAFDTVPSAKPGLIHTIRRTWHDWSVGGTPNQYRVAFDFNLQELEILDRLVVALYVNDAATRNVLVYVGGYVPTPIVA